MIELRELIKALLVLQDVDTHIECLQQEQTEAPRRVAELTALLAEKKAAQAQAEAEKVELDSRIQELEKNLEEAERKSKRSQGKLGEVKNSRQHKAIMKELDDLKSLKEDWTGQLEQAKEAMTGVISRLTQSGDEAVRTAETLAVEQAGLEAGKAKTAEDLARLRAEREVVAKGVPYDYLDQYNFIRSRLKDAAVAPVVGGTCQVCHMTLTPQSYNELRRLESLMTCPNCRRIIYWAEGLTA